MVDKIANNIANIDVRINKNSSKKPIFNENSDNISVEKASDIKIEKKAIVNDLALNAPIDHDKVSSIKKAISSGDYPLDLDKITDALMEAYNDIKSWNLRIKSAFWK